jgi:hypothetical protein
MIKTIFLVFFFITTNVFSQVPASVEQLQLGYYRIKGQLLNLKQAKQDFEQTILVYPRTSRKFIIKMKVVNPMDLMALQNSNVQMVIKVLEVGRADKVLTQFHGEIVPLDDLSVFKLPIVEKIP